MTIAMPETHRYLEKNKLIKNDLKRCKAKVLFEQKTDVLITRIQVLEKENAESSRLLKKEMQSSLEKSQFISTASHDCRSPLTSIQLSASLIERYSHRLDKQKLFAHIDKIKLAVVELTDKLNELIET